jgi:regulator of replication initiation timing
MTDYIEAANNAHTRINQWERANADLLKKVEEAKHLSIENDTLKARIKQLEKIEETMKALKGLL